mmetsp:Transcript_15532/g.21647  ORF Transcript_15532/g.21647 Transcript_15532/m.21647 type:complete len:316 (-) Transcript_15532:1150-2097(-)
MKIRPANPITLQASLIRRVPFKSFSTIKNKMSTSQSDVKTFKFAGLQLMVTPNKEKNLENARNKIKEAATKGAQVICLPECWNCPYSTDVFEEYAEATAEGNPSYNMLSSIAKDLKVYLIGGSIPERDATTNKIYNTCMVFDKDGKMVTKHRKVHLFDIDIPGRITFKESKVLSAGNQFTTFSTEFCDIGVGICYDIRFPEYAQLVASKGVKMLCYPGAFNMTTGPAHWELLQRSRAVDNQLFVAAVSPCRNPESTYQAWGHSTVVNPWGEVIATTDHNADIIYAEIDLKKVEEMRSGIPTLSQKRQDLYELRAI